MSEEEKEKEREREREGEHEQEQACMGSGCMGRIIQLIFHRQHRILLNTNQQQQQQQQQPHSSSTPTTAAISSSLLISPHSIPIQDSTKSARLSHVYLTKPYPNPPQATPPKNPMIPESQEVIMEGLSECLGILSRLSESSWVNPNNRDSNKHFSSNGREDRRASSVDYNVSLMNLQKLTEAPRLSLDSKLSSDTTFSDHITTITKGQSSREKLHRNVVAKLMGLDEIPDRCYSARELSDDTHYAKLGSNNHIIFNRNRGKSEGSLSKISESILSQTDEDDDEDKKGILNSTIYLDSKLSSENQVQSMDDFCTNLDSLLEKQYMTSLKQLIDYRQPRRPPNRLQLKHFSHAKQKIISEEETKPRRIPIITDLKRTEKSKKVAPIVIIDPVGKRNRRIPQFTEAKKPYNTLVSESIRSIETSNKQKGKKALHLHHFPCNKEKINTSRKDSSKKCTKASSGVREFRNATVFAGRSQANAINSSKSRKPESRSNPIMHNSYTKTSPPSQNDPVENWNEKGGSIVEAENTEQPSPISVLQISFSSNESYQLPNSDHNLDYSGSRTIDSTPINSNIVLDYHHSETEATKADCSNNSHSGRLEYKQDKINHRSKLGLSEEGINLTSKVLASIDQVFLKSDGKHSLKLNNSSEEENRSKKPEAKDEWIRSLLYDTVNEILMKRLLKQNQPWVASFDWQRGNINNERPESLLIKEVLEELDNLQRIPSEEIPNTLLVLIEKDLAYPQNEWSGCMQEERGEIGMELESFIFKKLIDEIIEDLIRSH